LRKGVTRQKFGFGAAREYRIQLSSAALAQPVGLSRLRTIVDNGRFADHGDFTCLRLSLLRPICGFPFLRIPSKQTRVEGDEEGEWFGWQEDWKG
jgi:hypothetical protein